MQTLTFKAQLTYEFFTTVNEMFGESSQLLTTTKRAVIKSFLHSSDNETVLGSSCKLGTPV